MRIGIIGAENSHTAAAARILNVEKKFPGVRVEVVWGETEAPARNAAEAGQIPTRPTSLSRRPRGDAPLVLARCRALPNVVPGELWCLRYCH